MVRMEMISLDGQHNMLIGITREEFDNMAKKGAIVIELDEEMKKMGSIILVGGDTEASIEQEVKRKIAPAPQG